MIGALVKKELKTLFASPTLAVLSALFIFLTGFAFTAALTQITPQRLPEASVRGIVYFMAVLFLFINPFLTMRSFAEEKKTGTLEFLRTSPLTDTSLVLGKFFGVLLVVAFILFLTLEFPIFIFFLGQPDVGVMLLSYLGLFLLAATFLASGIFFSVLSKNPMVSAMLSFVFNLTLWFLAEIGGDLGEAVSPISHLQSFSTGVLDASDVAYYLLSTAAFLFLSVRVLEAERWR